MTKKSEKENLKLYKAILSLKTPEECEAFFKDIFTFQEVESISQRLAVACYLTEGKSYVDINRLTGASTATICRVSRALNYGDGGYKTVIERLEKNAD